MTSAKGPLRLDVGDLLRQFDHGEAQRQLVVRARMELLAKLFAQSIQLTQLFGAGTHGGAAIYH